jgi:hypothetical protein
MTLEEQIEAGCNDWCADDGSNHYYGETKALALVSRTIREAAVKFTNKEKARTLFGLFSFIF